MGVSWGALAGSFLAPFLYGLYWKKTTKASVWVSFGFGTLLMTLQMLISMGTLPAPSGALGFIFTNSLYSGVFAMLGGLILVPIVSLLTPKMQAEKVAQMFEGYNGTVVVSATTALSDKKQ